MNDSVVKKLKVDSRLSAMAMNRTVHKGKSVVAAFAAYFGRICFGNNNLTVAIRAARNRLRCPPGPVGIADTAPVILVVTPPQARHDDG